MKQKIHEIFEGSVVAEIYERRRETDGRCFYDTIVRRRYFDSESLEHRTDYLQKNDLDDMHIVLVKAKKYIVQKLFESKGEVEID
jgi:hypothetical protein